VKLNYLKGALLHHRNIIALAVAFIVLHAELFPIPFLKEDFAIYGLSLAVYAAFAAQSLLDQTFRTDLENKQLIAQIKRVSEECRRSARNLKRKLDTTAAQRLSVVIREMDEIVRSFLGGDKTPLKARVVNKSLTLATTYIKMTDMLRIRSRDSDGTRISFLAQRINTNTSNLNNIRDHGIAEEIRRVIETDEKMIEALKNERRELEKLDARLQYMESTIGMLKYNIISNLESEDTLNDLEDEVNEASALNSVLNDRYEERRDGRRARL
jgi:hypothetical protein